MTSAGTEAWDPEGVKKAFASWDSNGVGKIAIDHLKDVLRECDPTYTEKELHMLCGRRKTGHIEYSDFLEMVFDTGEIDPVTQKLDKISGRGGVSRVIMKNGPGAFQDLQDFMTGTEDHIKKTLFAQDSKDPLHALDVWKVNGAKVYSYTGLDEINKHDGTTAVGVLMLDRYAIQERVGDPASPFTWSPYQAFYVIPKGVDFAMCKAVGCSGHRAAEVHPEETRTICVGLGALAEVAANEGKTRLFITGDCGYYALAVAAYVPILSSFSGWVQKGDAAFNAPAFRVNDKIDVFICLGTTQMISTPDPAKNLVSRMTDSICVYGTADLRGWYAGGTLERLNMEYPAGSKMNGILRCNEGITWGWALAYATKEEEIAGIWQDVGSILVEFVDYSMHFLLGMYVAKALHKKEKPCVESTKAHWDSIPKRAKKLLEDLHDDITPYKDFARVGMFEVFKKLIRDGIMREGQNVDVGALKVEDMTSGEWLAVTVYLVGIRGKDLAASTAKHWQRYNERFDAAIKEIIEFDEGDIDLPGVGELTLAGRYIEWYCKFNMHLNKTILKSAYQQKLVGHAIDAENVFLFDCKYVPGFGKQVADGLTVWTHAPFYFWLSFCYARFVTEVRTAIVDKPIVYHLECTELFSFTDFLQQQGVPVVDNPNYMYLASLSTNTPLKFKRYTGSKASAALLCASDTGKWYRDSDVPLRTPDHDGAEYQQHKHYFFAPEFPSLCEIEWDKCLKARPNYGYDTIAFGRDRHLYVGSTELVESYVGAPRDFPAIESKLKGSVQYK